MPRWVRYSAMASLTGAGNSAIAASSPTRKAGRRNVAAGRAAGEHGRQQSAVAWLLGKVAGEVVLDHRGGGVDELRGVGCGEGVDLEQVAGLEQAAEVGADERGAQLALIVNDDLGDEGEDGGAVDGLQALRGVLVKSIAISRQPRASAVRASSATICSSTPRASARQLSARSGTVNTFAAARCRTTPTVP